MTVVRDDEDDEEASAFDRSGAAGAIVSRRANDSVGRSNSSKSSGENRDTGGRASFDGPATAFVGRVGGRERPGPADVDRLEFARAVRAVENPFSELKDWARPAEARAADTLGPGSEVVR
jgi:hypothetical protein